MPKTGMYVLQGVEPAKIAAAPFDVKVVETYDDDGQPFSPAQVKQMGGGPGQALLLGYFSLGQIEEYRSYFNTAPRSAIGPANPDWPGSYEVKYWTPEWKTIAKAEINRMIAAGYDGIYFDVVDEFQLPWAQMHAPGGDAASAMKGLVKELSAYAKSKVSTFKVWVNGAEELLTDTAYVKAIDGLFKENLFYNFDGSRPNSAADTKWSLDYLKLAQAAGKDVIAIEYVNGAAAIADVQRKADAAGTGSYIGDLNLNGVNMDGVRPGQVKNLTGSGLADTLTGNALANTLSGLGGNDVLAGAGGADVLIGGLGTDTATYTASAAGVSVNLATGTGVGGDAQGDRLSEVENLTGSGLADTLTGNALANTLNGLGGNDVLVGAGGADVLIGGLGLDRFDFNFISESLPGAGRDVISGFVGNGSLAGDQIDLSTIDANVSVLAPGNQAFRFIGSAAFTPATSFNPSGAAAQLRYAGGVLQGSTDADTAAEFEIQLTGAPALSVGTLGSDILL